MFMPRATRVKRQESDLRLARCFQQSDLPLPTGGLSNPIVRMGRSPAHVPACWVDQKFCDISCTFGIDKLTDLYTCIIMQGAKI